MYSLFTITASNQLPHNPARLVVVVVVVVVVVGGGGGGGVVGGVVATAAAGAANMGSCQNQITLPVGSPSSPISKSKLCAAAECRKSWTSASALAALFILYLSNKEDHTNALTPDLTIQHCIGVHEGASAAQHTHALTHQR